MPLVPDDDEPREAIDVRKQYRRGIGWFAATMVVAWSVLTVMAMTSAGANDQVCAGTQVAFEDLPATIDGVTITVVDDDTVHFDIPEGSTVTVCVKAGSAEQGDGPETTTLTADADLDHSSGKEISHVSVISVTTPTTPPPTTPPPTTPPPTTPPPTTPPPTTPPPTTPPPTTPPPTTPPPGVSVLIEKTNDANEDGVFSNNEESKNEGRDVDFKLVITNTSNVAVEITDLTDSFDQTTLDLLADECSSLSGTVLDPDESVTCTFTLSNYSPPEDTDLVNVAEVCVVMVGGTPTACDTNPSRVHSAVVLGTTVTPTPPAPTTTTPPGGIAFTGPSSALVLTALALALLTLGTGLMWAGRRRERPDMG
jgi:cell division septation protein DedD